MRFILQFLMILSLSYPSWAADSELQTKRFTKWTGNIATALGAGNVDAIANELVGGLNRVASFNLQALGRVYAHVDYDYFNKSIRSEFKLLEDAIGEFKKWRDLLDNAIDQGASDSKITNFNRKKTVSKIELKYLLTMKKKPMKDYLDEFENELKKEAREKLGLNGDEPLPSDEKDKIKKKVSQIDKRFKKYRKKIAKWMAQSQFEDRRWIPEDPNEVTKLQDIETSIHNRDWGSYEEDRANALDGLINQLTKVRDEEHFSFDVLENEVPGIDGRTEYKSGIHEFRREIRWFNFQAASLGGLVSIEDTTELLKAYKQLGKAKKAEYPTEEERIKSIKEAKSNVEQQTLPLLVSCPVEGFKEYVKDKKMVKNKYTQLPANKDENVCTIPACLYYAMAKIVAQVGDIKDYVEQQHSLSNDGLIKCRDGSTENYTPEKYDGHWNNVPKCIEEEIQASYDFNIKDNQLMKHLINKLETCKSN